MSTKYIKPFVLKDTPSLIERLLPVQKISVESYAEQMANTGKTLTALGSYWKGRKPLVLTKACVLGCLLPATSDPKTDLDIFEMLMAMDDDSMSRRSNSIRPENILLATRLSDLTTYFKFTPDQDIPVESPVDVRALGLKVSWRKDLPQSLKQKVISQYLAGMPFRQRVSMVARAEAVDQASLYAPVWGRVNAHLGTNAESIPELVEQLGIMRFGHRPRVADPFAGSGQIPFEAARLGCDVFASDLNPVACMLTWGAFSIVGADKEDREVIESQQQDLVRWTQSEVDSLGVETDGKGWRGRAYLYCAEVLCPQSGWRVPLLPSRVVSVDDNAIAELIPDAQRKRYDIKVRVGVSKVEMADAKTGTIVRDGKYGEAIVCHQVAGIEYRTKISSLRGDFQSPDGSTRNHLRAWGRDDFVPRPDDLIHERLYCIQWVRCDGKGDAFAYRSVTEEDLQREKLVEDFVRKNFESWQSEGLIPDMRIEFGGPPRYQGLDLFRARGWTYWSHAFNPRQLMVNALLNKKSNAYLKLPFANVIQHNAKLSMWDTSGGGRAGIKGVFYNQALNTLYNYGARGTEYVKQLVARDYKSYPLSSECIRSVVAQAADQISEEQDLYISDPPYGDAVKYEEILDFFIAWLRKNPPREFSKWVWDSRRALAIKGEDHDFKLNMVKAYKRMAECMSTNGLQIIMFTHQSNSIWADMANIVWASGLKVSAAWYIVTETDSALRDGQYVKGTILLVLRKRTDSLDSSRDELAYELEDEVKSQVEMLTGLNQEAKDLYRDENLFEDADLQMAGYAAALRVLTKYSAIDGVSMPQEALRPRVKGHTSMVDELIAFAVGKANEYLVPHGLTHAVWTKLKGSERFYLKMIETESRGPIALADCQNYAKAFKVEDYDELLDEVRANKATIKSAAGFAKRGMSSNDEFGSSLVRSVLYGIYLLGDGKTKSDDVIHQLKALIPSYYHERDQIKAIAHFLNHTTAGTRPEESARAMILRDLVHNERG